MLIPGLAYNNPPLCPVEDKGKCYDGNKNRKQTNQNVQDLHGLSR